MSKQVIVVGAGLAGMTAATETVGDVKPTPVKDESCFSKEAVEDVKSPEYRFTLNQTPDDPNANPSWNLKK